MLYVITFRTEAKRKYPNGELIKLVLPANMTVEEVNNYIKYKFGKVNELQLINTVSHVIVSSARA